MKMKILIVMSLLSSFSVYANEHDDNLKDSQADKNRAETEAIRAGIRAQETATAATQSNAACENYKASKKAAAKQMVNAGPNDELDGDTGTPLMQKCVKMSGGAMRYLYGKNKRGINWTAIVEATDECVSADTQCLGTNPNPSEITAKKEACDNVKKLAARCDAAAYIISKFERDWENPDHVVTKDVKGGNPAITCQGKGIATVDYEACVKFVQNGDIMDVAQGAIQQGQQLYYADKTMDAQAKAAQSGNTATGALEALKSGVKSQEEMLNQRAALDAGKFAALASTYSDIPDADTLQEKCSNWHAPEGLNDQNACTYVVSHQHEFAFLQNQQAKEKMKAKLVKVGIDVTSNAVMASLMGKRAGEIDNAIANVQAFKPIDPIAPPADNVQTTYCQQNPGDTKCLTGGLERTFDAMGDNVITFGEGGTGSTYQNTNPFGDPGTTTTTTNNAIPTNGNRVGGMGGVISAAQQNGGLASVIPAGTVTKGQAPAGGGGGGGGGGIGGGGGGGGGAPGAQPQGGVSAAIQGKTPTYGGGSGTLSMMGGYGINKSKSAAKADANPFGKLFNKDGNKNGVMNFRDIASQKVGTKGDNIFDMISKRYSSVNGDKRLLEYELTK